MHKAITTFITSLFLANLASVAHAQTAPQAELETQSIGVAALFDGLEPRSVESDFETIPNSVNTDIRRVGTLQTLIERTYLLEQLEDDAELAAQSQNFDPASLEVNPIIREDNLQIQVQTDLE
ncbi:MAG: hypothetical protein Kow00121_28170 [Elainellaceae cyanobacterium]